METKDLFRGQGHGWALTQLPPISPFAKAFHLYLKANNISETFQDNKSKKTGLFTFFFSFLSWGEPPAESYTM